MQWFGHLFGVRRPGAALLLDDVWSRPKRRQAAALHGGAWIYWL